MSDNNVVHVEAEAHATQSSDRIEQTAGSSEGVKKIKEKHSTTEFVNIQRKDDECNADDDCTSGNVQNDGTLHPRGNKKSRRHSVHATEDVDGHLSSRLMQLRTQPKRARPIVLDQSLVQPPRTSEMSKPRKMMMRMMNSSLYVHRRNRRRDTVQNGNRELIGKR